MLLLGINIGMYLEVTFPVLFFPKANASQSPYKKLKEALSSVEAFEKHYLVSTVFAYLY